MTQVIDRHRPPLGLIVAAFAVVYLVWGSTYLAIAYVVDTMPPLLAAGARFCLAGVILFSFLQACWPTPITIAQWRAAALIGALLLLGGNGIVCLAQQKVPSGIAALIVGSAPLWFTTLDALFYKGPRPTRRILLGLLVGSTGVCLLVFSTKDMELKEGAFWPAVSLIAACFFWALGSLHSRRAGLPSSPFLSTAMQMICGGASQMLVGLLIGEAGKVNLSAFTTQSWLAWGYLVVFGSLLSFTCYVWLLRVATPTQVSTYAYVNPVIAVVLGVLVREEPVSSAALVAAGLIISAVILITTAKRKQNVVAQANDVPVERLSDAAGDESVPRRPTSGSARTSA